jgi:RNA recognition motif-containing protein
MSAAAVDNVTADMANTTLDPAKTGETGDKAVSGEAEANSASAAEGRRLYIGNLAYATTEGELKEFFKDYLVYVLAAGPSRHPPSTFLTLADLSSAANPPPSPRTPVPAARLATRSWTCPLPLRPSVPSVS